MQALDSCEAEDVGACFALLASLQASGSQLCAETPDDEVSSTHAASGRTWGSALHLAAARDFAVTARLLVEVGKVDLHFNDSLDGLAALDVAISAGNAKTASLLLDLGAVPSQPQDALLVAVGHARKPGLAAVASRLAASHLADVDATIDLGMEYEDADVVLRLLSFPEASDRGWVRQWALRRTALLGEPRLVERALALEGVEVDHGAGSSVGSALLLAAEAGHAEACCQLLRHGASPHATRVSASGAWTVTDLAAMRGHEAVLRVLAEYGGPRAGDEAAGHPAAAAVIALSAALAQPANGVRTSGHGDGVGNGTDSE